MQSIENLKKIRKKFEVTVITILKILSRKKVHKIFHIFLFFSIHANYKKFSLCGHFDTHIAKYKLFWKNNCRFLAKIQFEKGRVIMNREGVKKNYFQFWKERGQKLNHAKNQYYQFYLRSEIKNFGRNSRPGARNNATS